MPPKILAVDDDLAILQLLQLMLEHLDCEVLALSDSRLAAELVNHQEFDGIFLDAQMPNIDGLELARLIRDSAKNRRVPVVIFTGGHDPQSRSSDLHEAVTFFVGKPFDMETLEGVLARIGVRAEKV